MKNGSIISKLDFCFVKVALALAESESHEGYGRKVIKQQEL